jgi:uncharacterized protein
MARAPSARGKTRLAPHVPPGRLVDLRRALLADTLDLVCRLRGVDAHVFFTPDDGEADIAALLPRPLPCVPQEGRDLGARMRAALRHLIDARRCGSAILAGTDIPLLTQVHFAEAHDALRERAAVVFGPAGDGGYYLVGMSEVHARLFEGIAWDGGAVLEETLAIARRLGIETPVIRAACDVDTIHDLRRIERDLAAAPPDVAPHLCRWFAPARTRRE